MYDFVIKIDPLVNAITQAADELENVGDPQIVKARMVVFEKKFLAEGNKVMMKVRDICHGIDVSEGIARDIAQVMNHRRRLKNEQVIKTEILANLRKYKFIINIIKYATHTKYGFVICK